MLSDKFLNMQIVVKKLSLQDKSPEEFAQEVCEMTFLGKSKIPLHRLYLSEHSPVRTQLFWITFKPIPLFIATHFIRHHVGSIPFQLTCRDDRKGANVNLKTKLSNLASLSAASGEVDLDMIDDIYQTTDRYTPVNLGILVNAQALIDMAKLRLCQQSHKETIYVFKKLVEALREVDSSLASVLVPKCVYRGGICGEPMACGWNKTEKFQKTLAEYLSNFNKKQIGVNLETIVK